MNLKLELGTLNLELNLTHHFLLKRVTPKKNVITKRVINMKNRIFAIDAAPAAIPPNPKSAEIMAITKKIMA